MFFLFYFFPLSHKPNQKNIKKKKKKKKNPMTPSASRKKPVARSSNPASTTTTTTTTTSSSASSSSLTNSSKNRHYAHLHSQLAQLNAHLADTENLVRMTAVQAQDIRFLGGYLGALFVGSAKVLGEESLGHGSGAEEGRRPSGEK